MSTPITSDTAIRLNYHNGMFLTADSMATEQSYFSNWIILQNQYLYTPGVLNGFAVTRQNNTLIVSEGAGFDADGHFLIFPGTSGNALTIPGGASNPCAVYAVYPDNSGASGDTSNQTAQLQIASPDSGPQNSILLAQVSLDGNGNITEVTDKRTPVKSRLPANLAGATTLGSEERIANQSLRGTVTVSAGDIGKPQTVHFLQQQGPAFTRPPQVFITVQGATPFATSVNNVTTEQFEMTLSEVQSDVTQTAPVTVNWLAIPE